MKPGFTAQTPGLLARHLARDWRWVMEHVWLSKCDKPARSFEEYDPLSLAVLLSGELGRAIEERNPPKTRKSVGRWGPPTLSGPKSYDGAIRTGDPIADEWERDIAAGKIPDW